MIKTAPTPLRQLHTISLSALASLLSLASLSANQLTVSAAIDTAIEQNANLQAARHQIAIAQHSASGRGLLSNPELEVETGSTQAGEYEIEVAMLQPFPLTNRLRLERQIGDFDILAAKLEILQAERALALQTEQYYWQTLAAQQRLSELQDIQQLLTEQAQSAQQSAERGELSPLDARRLNLSANSISQEINQARAEVLQFRSQLIQALSYDYNTEFSLSGNLSLPAQAEQAPAALTNIHPSIVSTMLGIQQAETQVQLAQAQRFDDVAGGVIVRQEGGGQAEDSTFVGLVLSVPLPMWNRGNAEIQAAQASAQQQRQLAQAQLQTLNRQLQAKRALSRQTHQNAQNMNSLNQEASETETLLDQAYSQGEASILELIDARRQAQRIQVETIERQLQYHLQAAELRHYALTQQQTRSRALELIETMSSIVSNNEPRTETSK